MSVALAAVTCTSRATAERLPPTHLERDDGVAVLVRTVEHVSQRMHRLQERHVHIRRG